VVRDQCSTSRGKFEWSIASLDRIGTRALHGRPR
jgi:hypothetical protein